MTVTKESTLKSLSEYILELSEALHEEIKVKDIVINKDCYKKSRKVFSQSSLPIKREARPKMKSNYRPNTYINNNYRNKF